MKKRKERKARNYDAMEMILRKKDCSMRDRRMRRAKEKEDYMPKNETSNLEEQFKIEDANPGDEVMSNTFSNEHMTFSYTKREVHYSKARHHNDMHYIECEILNDIIHPIFGIICDAGEKLERIVFSYDEDIHPDLDGLVEFHKVDGAHIYSFEQYIKNPTEEVCRSLISKCGYNIQYIEHPSEEIQMLAYSECGREIIDYINCEVCQKLLNQIELEKMLG